MTHNTGDATMELYNTGTGSTVFICGSHNWILESLRGSNRNQRVEHSRCGICNKRRTRVWLGLPNQKKPDRVYRRSA